MSRFVTLDSVTAEAKTILKKATDKDRLVFKQWVYRALREIGPGKQNVEICTLYPKDHSMKKPDDCHSVIDIALYNSKDQEVKYRYNSGGNKIHVGRENFERLSATDSISNTVVDISEDDYYIHISSNTTNLVEYAKIRYFKFPVDDDGLPKIPEDQVHAITIFIRYMWMMREDQSASRVDEAYRTWVMERSRAKSRNKMPSMLEGKQIAKEWMSMIDKPFFDRF